MGPRSKPRVEFVICGECKCQFSSRDKEKHPSLCREFPSEEFTSSSVKLVHGFINARCLTSESKFEDPPKHLPSTHQNDVILLHPTAMQLLSLTLGAPAVVHGEQTTDQCCRVMSAWPNPASELTGVAFVRCVTGGLQPTKIPSRIWVSPLDTPVVSAQQVLIKPREHKAYLRTREFLDFIHRWCDGKFLTKGNRISISYYGQPCHFDIMDIMGHQEHQGQTSCVEDLSGRLAGVSLEQELESRSEKQYFFRVDSSTGFILHEELDKNDALKRSRTMSLEQVGGLGSQVKSLKELIDLHFKGNLVTAKGLCLPKGILLHGPSGTGKTMLARALITYAAVHTVEIQGTELWSRYYGESENRLAAKFQEAKDRAPCIILIDEVDAVCPRRQSSNNEVEKRMVSSLMTLMDKTLSAENNIVVIAATNKREEIDPGLRRPGRLEREVEIGIPSARDRAEVIKSLLLDTSHTLSEEDVKQIADQAHGFVGADLAAVCKEAGIRTLKRSGTADKRVELQDLKIALKTVQPSAMREVALEVSQVSWEDIGGQVELKHKLKQAIEWPLQHPESFQRMGIRPPRGLLMYGPPGCSKTMIAKALAHESNLNFIAIKGPELFSKWVGESERAVREVFRKARAAAPAIVFFDEIDSIAGERGSHGGSGGGEVGDRVLAQLLTEIDGVVALQDVTVVAATNRPERIDKALLRPGRLDRIVYVPLPDDATRKEIFSIHFRKTPVAEDVDVNWLVVSTHRYSGAEVSAVCHEAALSAMQEDLDITHVYRRHFETALHTVTPRIDQQAIDNYDKYAKNSGLHSL